MLPQNILKCFSKQKTGPSRDASETWHDALNQAQTKPQTCPSPLWQAAGLDVEEIVGPHRARFPVVQDGWDVAAQQRVIVKLYKSHTEAQQEFCLTQVLVHPRVVRATRLAAVPKVSNQALAGCCHAHSQRAYTTTPLASGVPLAHAGVLVGYQRVLFDCLDALAYIHRQGVIHNDLHAENIITDGHAGYIIDFDASFGGHAQSERRADVASLLSCFAGHLPEANRAAYANFCGSRVIRRWGRRVPSREQIARDAFFSALT